MLERREEKGWVAALASPQPVPPCSSPFIQEIHGELRSLVCAGPARLQLTACVLPSLAAGCGFGSQRPDGCCLNGSCLRLPKSCAPAITLTLPWPGWQGWLCCGVSQLQHSCPHCWEVLGCSWSCCPVSSSLLEALKRAKHRLGLYRLSWWQFPAPGRVGSCSRIKGEALILP